MSLYTFVKSAYRVIVPRALDRRAFGGETRFSRTILRVKAALEESASHDDLYDSHYYSRQDSEMKISSVGIARSIKEGMPDVATVIDVGCGSGAVMEELRALGLQCRGLDYSEAAIELCRAKGLDVIKFDLESEARGSVGTADLALSTEVAEHLPPQFADSFVALLTETADIVIITAATPGQGGTDHVNEQPNAYWIEKFCSVGFSQDPDEMAAWRSDWQSRGVDRARSKNLMIFRKVIE